VEEVRRKLRVVMLVDDHVETLRAWKRDIALKFSQEIRVLDAADTHAALTIVSAAIPDLAVVDQHLQNGLGTDLLLELRSRAPTMLTILTSADPTLDDARRAGPNTLAVLPKPRSWAPLFRAIEAGDDVTLLPEQPATLSLEAFGAAHISRVLRSQRNNITATAQVLGMDRSGLRRKLDKLGISIDRTKDDQTQGDSGSSLSPSTAASSES